MRWRSIVNDIDKHDHCPMSLTCSIVAGHLQYKLVVVFSKWYIFCQYLWCWTNRKSRKFSHLNWWLAKLLHACFSLYLPGHLYFFYCNRNSFLSASVFADNFMGDGKGILFVAMLPSRNICYFNHFYFCVQANIYWKALYFYN